MSADQPGSLPGPHRDRSQGGPPSPERLDRGGPGGGGGEVRAYYDDVIRLPGFGQQPNRCAPRKPVGFCSKEGHVALASASPCETRRCPEHWSMWQEQAAVKIVARLAAYRHAQSGAGRRLLHVVDSPGRDRRWSADAVWDERRPSYEAVESVGGRGGVVIPHPYRTSGEGDWLFKTAVEEGDWEEEWGKWSCLRSAADDWEEMKRFVEAGPHYHHLVPAEDFDPAGVPDGRVVNNIRSLDRFQIRDMTGYRDMARTAMYLLSHAAYQPPGADGSGGRNTVTYWGDVHPNGFKPEEELTATEWDRIQENAERAVTTTPSDDLPAAGEGGEDRDDCHEDGCDGKIVALDELRGWLDREEWVGSLELRQRWILTGVRVWLDEGGHKPPPSSNPRRVREYFRQIGREEMDIQQVGMGAFS